MSRRTQVSSYIHAMCTFCLGFGIGVLLNFVVTVSWDAFQGSPAPSRWYSSDRKGESNELREEIDTKFDGLHPFDVIPPRAASQPRILCYLLVGPSTHHTALHVKHTWGQRCDKTIFFSTRHDDLLGTVILDVPEGYSVLWAKSMAALNHLYRNYSDYDWFLKGDDDTYVIVENLRKFLGTREAENPVYFGVKFRKFVKQGYMSGGGGYVLSREALRRFAEDAVRIKDQEKCPNRSTKGAEDLQLGLCLEAVGVKAGDGLDEEGKPLFFSHSPTSLFYKVALINKLHWYWRYIWHKHEVGPDCCSIHPISFHEIDPRMMWTLEVLLYRVHIHRELQPPHLNYSTSPVPPTGETSVTVPSRSETPLSSNTAPPDRS
ncbi:glycoprotein-N-acetylgalactosamine 3-beta-galactosyltransferase 1-like isoform X2 [Oratosquilla oratoria]